MTGSGGRNLKCSTTLCWHRLLLGAAVCLLAANTSSADVERVLNAGDKNDRGQAAVRARKSSLNSASAFTIIQKEEDPDVAGLVLGMYLEQLEFDPGRTSIVVKAAAARHDLFGKATTMAALSPHMEKIVAELVKSRKKDDHLLAATILAVYARSVAQIPLQADKKKGGKNKGAQSSKHRDVTKVDISPFLTELFKVREKNVMELVVLAAAYDKTAALEDRITRMKGGSVELLGAQMFFLSRMGKPVPEKLAGAAFRAKRKIDKRYLGLGPNIADYDVRTHGTVYVTQAIGEAADEALVVHLHKAVDHIDRRVQMDAIRSIEKVGSQSSLPVLFKKLNGGECNWPIKVVTLSALGAIPNKNSIEPLMDILAKEKGRFRQDAIYALSSIAGKQHGKTVNEWRQWWAANRESFKVDPKASKEFREKTKVQHIEVPSLTEFYGLPIISDHVVFVLDTSASMKGQKIQMLKGQMDNTLNNLPNKVWFNVVNFGGVVNIMYDGGMMEASDASGAGDIVREMTLTFGTRTYDAIEAGIGISQMDTIIYLSDGAPVAGQWESWRRIGRAIELLDRYRPVAIHSIYYSGQAKAAGAAAKGGKRRRRAGGVAKVMEEFSGRNFGVMAIGEDKAAENDNTIKNQLKELEEKEKAEQAKKAREAKDKEATDAADAEGKKPTPKDKKPGAKPAEKADDAKAKQEADRAAKKKPDEK